MNFHVFSFEHNFVELHFVKFKSHENKLVPLKKACHLFARKKKLLQTPIIKELRREYTYIS